MNEDYHQEIVQSQTMLSFESIEAFQCAASKGVTTNPTRSEGGESHQEDFLSLKEYLTELAIGNLDKDFIESSKKEGLDYEPEDSIIVDPNLLEILNKDREVRIDGYIYRFVQEGLFKYKDSYQFSPSWIDMINASELENKTEVCISPNVYFTRIVYAEEQSTPELKSSNFSTRRIALADGTIIYSDKINSAQFEQGNGDASGFQMFVSGLFGTNVVVENYYDSNNRMKVRLYDQDYIIYRSVGMTVRMQHKSLGIWWRKTAQEFRYGWTALECSFTYSTSPFTGDDLPKALIKTVVGNNNDIVFFHTTNLYTTNGDIEEVYEDCMDDVSNLVYSFEHDPVVSQYWDNPKSVYSTSNSNKTVTLLFPQDEDFAFDEGKETHRWDIQPFSGTITGIITHVINGNTTFGLDDISFGDSVDVVIGRGRIYGAVKYQNEWRACVIESV